MEFGRGSIAGYVTDDKYQSSIKQGIRNDSLYLKIAQVIFSPLLILNSRSIWFLQTPYRKSVAGYVTDERQFYIYHL